jgi:hypothetical protein
MPFHCSPIRQLEQNVNESNRKQPLDWRTAYKSSGCFGMMNAVLPIRNRIASVLLTGFHEKTENTGMYCYRWILRIVCVN